MSLAARSRERALIAYRGGRREHIAMALAPTTGWSVPLFLFVSGANRDAALLTGAPTGDVGANDYVKLFDEPVAFAHASEAAHPAQHPFVTLRAYWSAERRDIQTTTESLRDLNNHGGNYTLLQTIGEVAVALTAGQSSAAFVPLHLSYDRAREDAVSAPLSGADLNHLVAGAAYPTGRAFGFVATAGCRLCNVSMSEAFPSAGGADCAYPCAASDLACDTTTYRLGEIRSPAAAAFAAAMDAAGKIVESLGHATVERGLHLHMSLNYLCCYSAQDLETIHGVLNGLQWPPLNVSFDRPVWRINGHGTGTPTIENTDHMSMIVLLDRPSQRVMQAFVEDVEARIRAAGIDVHVPRAAQEPFHSTLAVVSGAAYPAAAALKAVNAAVPPGSWNAQGAITLPPPKIATVQVY